MKHSMQWVLSVFSVSVFVLVTWTLPFYNWILMDSLTFNVRRSVLVLCVCVCVYIRYIYLYIFFVLLSRFIKQVKVNSAANSFFSTQKSLLFLASSRRDPCSSVLLPHQSDKSLALPLSAQVSPATVSNECCFNLRLIAEWHFPLWAPALLSFFDLSGNLECLRLEHNV